MNPTININGTHPDDLASTYGRATDALRSAYRLINDIAPHPRDYLSHGEWLAAKLIHARWLRALTNLSAEVEDVEIHIHDQILDGKQ